MAEKRIPADTTLTEPTFLNDKKVDGELYAYLQSISMPVENEGKMETRVYFKNMATQAKICEKVKIKSPKTYKVHLNYLIENGYIEVKDDYYLLNNKENAFLMIPLETLQFLVDVVQEHIIKIYVYLGQRYKYGLTLGKQWEFTIQEVADHVGLKLDGTPRSYAIINHALEALSSFGLISYVSFFDGKAPKKKLTGFSFEYKKPE